MSAQPSASTDLAAPWGWDVDLSADPFDLRPAADAVVKAIEKSSREHPGQPAIVLMGEQHYSSASHLLIRLVMQRLIQRGKKIALGWEHSERSTVNCVRDYYNAAVADRLPDDPNGRDALTMRLAFPAKIFEPLARLNLHAFCIENNISIKLIDLPIRSPGSTEEPLLAEHPYLTAMKNLGGEAVRAVSPRGMAVRNMYMAEQIIAYADEQKADVYIIATGMSHVFGRVQMDTAYDTSLARIFNSTNCIPVVKDVKSIDFPAGYEAMAPRSVYIRGAADFIFSVRQNKQELAIMRAFDAHSGSEIGIANLKAHFADARAKMVARFGKPSPVMTNWLDKRLPSTVWGQWRHNWQESRRCRRKGRAPV